MNGAQLHPLWVGNTGERLIRIALLLSRMGPNLPSNTLMALPDAYIAQLRPYQTLDQTSSNTG